MPGQVIDSHHSHVEVAWNQVREGFPASQLLALEWEASHRDSGETSEEGQVSSRFQRKWEISGWISEKSPTRISLQEPLTSRGQL